MCVTYFTELAEFLRSRDLRVFYEGLHHVALILLFSTLLRSGRHDESCESEPKRKLRVELGNKLTSLQCRGERQHITHDPPVYSLLVAVNHLLHIPHPHLYVKNILISSLWDKNNVSWWVTLSLQPCGVFLEKAGLNVEREIAPGASAASRRTKVFFQGILSLQVSWATKEALSIEQTVISHHSNADLTDGFFGSFAKKKVNLSSRRCCWLTWIFTRVSKFKSQLPSPPLKFPWAREEPDVLWTALLMSACRSVTSSPALLPVGAAFHISRWRRTVVAFQPGQKKRPPLLFSYTTGYF